MIMPIDEIQPCYVCNRLGNQQGIDDLCIDCRNDVFPFSHLTNHDVSQLVGQSEPINYTERLDELEHQLFNHKLLNQMNDVMIFNDIDPI